jgi:hypothetical protein
LDCRCKCHHLASPDLTWSVLSCSSLEHYHIENQIGAVRVTITQVSAVSLQILKRGPSSTGRPLFSPTETTQSKFKVSPSSDPSYFIILSFSFSLPNRDSPSLLSQSSCLTRIKSTARLATAHNMTTTTSPKATTSSSKAITIKVTIRWASLRTMHRPDLEIINSRQATKPTIGKQHLYTP